MLSKGRSFPLFCSAQLSSTLLQGYIPIPDSGIEFSVIDNHIGQITMNNFPFRNALGKNTIADFSSLFDSLNSVGNHDIRVLVLHSTVPKVFCAGANLKERKEMTQPEAEAFVNKLRATFQQLENLPIPTIASIDGAAMGGGLELALSCDLRVGGKQSRYSLPETGLAIIPGAGGTQRLPRTIGVPRAKEMIYTGRILNSEEAYQWQLINKAVPEDSSLDSSLELANTILTKGPVAIRAAKSAISNGINTDLRTGFEIEKLCYAQVIPTQDRLEGLKAFAEKRKPIYKGE